MTFVSYAQNGEDVILWRVLRDVEKGFYVDVGACDPDDLSVTKAFSERGWCGINIEPVRHYYNLCVAKRPRDINLNVAVTARSGIARLKVVKDTGLSTTVDAVAANAAERGWPVEEQNVPALTLVDVFTTLPSREIHFLKIDVEGGEQAVLEGADFDRFRPWIIVIEATVPSSSVRTEHHWEHLLIEARYERILFDGVNLYYLAQEHGDLAEMLAAPPNALDDFKPIRLIKAEEQVAALTGDAHARQLDLKQTRAMLEALRLREKALQDENLELRSLLSHQTTSSQHRTSFLNRKLAQSRRKVFSLEEQAEAKGQIELSQDVVPTALEISQSVEQDVLAIDHYGIIAEEISIVVSPCLGHDCSEASVLRRGWTTVLRHLTVPVRKVKTATRVALTEPDRFVPLAMHNVGKLRVKKAAVRLALPSAESVVLLDIRSPPSTLPAPAQLTLMDQASIVSNPDFESLDRRDQIVALVSHDIAQQRLL